MDKQESGLTFTQKIFIFVVFILLAIVIGAILYYIFIYQQTIQLNELRIDTMKITWTAPEETNCDVTLTTNQFIKLPICWSKQIITVITGDAPVHDKFTITLPEGHYVIVSTYGTNATRDQIDVTLEDVEMNTTVIKILDRLETQPWTNFYKQGTVEFTLSKPTTIIGKFSNNVYSNNSSLSVVIIKT